MPQMRKSAFYCERPYFFSELYVPTKNQTQTNPQTNKKAANQHLYLEK